MQFPFSSQFKCPSQRLSLVLVGPIQAGKVQGLTRFQADNDKT
jgi:hypothetical protein